MPYTEIHAAHNQKEEVPEFVLSAVRDAVEKVLEANPMVRDMITAEVGAKMGNDWRFCSCYRHEASLLHSLIYNLCSTVRANYKADEIAAND